MTKRMSWMGALWALGVVLSISSSASAVTTVNLPKPGTSIVGMSGKAAYIITSASDGSGCTRTWLAGEWGLSDDAYIIMGTSGADTFLYATSSMSWCGYTVAPLWTNSRVVHFIGQGGNDFAVAGPGETPVADGGPGNDTLYPGPFTAQKILVGGANNDTLQSLGQSNVQLLGDAGDDRLCGHPSVPVHTMHGGSGTDTHCGTASNFHYTTIEAPNCSVCGY